MPGVIPGAISMKKILFVDDEPNVLAAFQRQLHKQFDLDVALGPELGLERLQTPENYAVVVADMRMPGMNGVEFLKRVKEASPDIVRMMLTGNADQDTAMEAVNLGSIFRFLTKPCPPETLVDALTAGLRQHQLIIAERDLLENTLCSSVKVLTDILAFVDPKAFAQSERLRENVRNAARILRLDNLWAIEMAAMLANIGRVTLPPEVILKLRLGHPLAPREQEIFNRLPEIGANLLAQIPRLEEVSRIIRYQKKRFDGEGFPADNIRGELIPFGARLLRTLNDFAELETACMSQTEALEKMRDHPGSYDPKLLDVLETLAAPAAPPSVPIEVKFADVRLGDVLRSDVVAKNGMLIVVAGYHVTPALMERLKNFASISGIREPLLVDGAARTEAPGPGGKPGDSPAPR